MAEKGFGHLEIGSRLWDVMGTGELKFLIPLRRRDGGPLKKDDPAGIEVAFCPFCGAPAQPNEEPKEAAA